MNLDFKTVSVETVKNRRYYKQTADVTRSSEFWRKWRTCSEALRSRITLVSIPNSGPRGGAKWLACRMVPADSEAPPAAFRSHYVLRDRSKLLPYQYRAVTGLCDSITRNGAALDGSDTGLGKTYVALATARELGLRPAIICVKAGIPTWKETCLYMGADPLFIVNWEYAKTGSKLPYVKKITDEWNGSVSYRWHLPRNTMLIFDEAHVANNRTSLNYALYIASKGYTSLACSATLADRPARLRGFLDVTGAVDKERFSEWLEARGHFTNERNEPEGIDETADMAAINRIVFPRYGYRLRYEDPDVRRWFPDAAYQTMMIPLSKNNTARQNALYRGMIERVSHYRALGQQARVMLADLRYRQAAELLKADSLAEIAVNYIAENHSCIIFVNFLETLSYLARKLRTNSLIYGNQERDGIHRARVIDSFQGDRSRIIIAMVSAGGQSISLHDLTGRHRRVSLICPTYNPITLRQIMGRTRRANSRTVPIIKLVYAAGTVEHKVALRVNAKLDNITALNDGDLMEPDIFRMGIDRKDTLHETD